MLDTGRLLVLYGSQTFTAQEAAERIWRTSKALGFCGPVQAMDEYPISRLIQEEFAIFVCATAGDGDEPDNMKRFWKFLLRKSLPANSLVKLKFGVLAFGDSSFSKFNFIGKKLHKRLMQLGATPLMDVGLCDYQHDLGNDAVMQPWIKEFYVRLKNYFPNIQTGNVKTNFIPRWKVSLIKTDHIPKENGINSQERLIEDIYFRDESKTDFMEANLVEVETNVRTTDETHFQDVRLITLKTTGNEVWDYKPGDVLNIRPRNSRQDVEDLFGIFVQYNMDIKPHYRLLVEECHQEMAVPHFLQRPLTMYEIAEQYWDLRTYPTQYVFSLLALVSGDTLERDKCTELGSPEGQEDWLNYCRRPRRTILEVLHDFHKSTAKLTIDILFELFSTIKPRSFSIASSALPSSGCKIDLLVAVVNYAGRLKKPRLGLASNWLKSLQPKDRVYGWLKHGTLKFPDDVTIPYIMVGPGTGLAPFRSVLQTRAYLGTATCDNMHLFFGCRFKSKDYHCREELEKWVLERKLSLFCAFSRDQEDKEYVQHKIAEHKRILYELITNQNAHIYISGNSKNIPDNVRDAFVENVLSEVGGIEVDSARDMLRDMEAKGRLQVETW